MGIKKVRIKPPGYTDIVHPETSADIVIFSEGGTVDAQLKNLEDDIKSYLADQDYGLITGTVTESDDYGAIA